MFELFKLGIPRDRNFGLGLLLTVLQGLSTVALMATSAWLISRAAEQPPVLYLMVAVVGVRGFALGRATFRYAERIVLHNSAFKMLADLRPKTFKALIPFAPAGLGKSGRGEFMSRAVSDVDELQNLPLRIIAPLVQSAIVTLISIIGLTILVPASGLVLLCASAATFLFALPFSAAISKKADRGFAATKGELSEQSLKLLENHDVLVAYGWLDYELEKLKSIDARLRSQERANSWSTGVGSAIITVLSSIALSLTTWLAATQVESGNLAGVQLALFALVTMAVFEILQAAQPVFAAWNRYQSSAKRVSEILNRQIPTELLSATGGSTPGELTKLEFLNVTAGYPGGPAVISDFDLTIAAGQTVALVGKSGSGKTTIAHLMLGFLAPRSGQIIFNGTERQQVSADWINTQIGVVEQNPMIFLGNVRENLLPAKPNASDEELIAVLSQVGLWQMFEIRDGLETGLGDRGVLISGGEAQRLALARALLADFRFLILDEPTANLDQVQGKALVSELLSIARQKTDRAIILISHDMTLADLADRTVSL